MNEWSEKLSSKAEELKTELREAETEEIVSDSGASLRRGEIVVTFLGDNYHLALPRFELVNEDVRGDLKALIFEYLTKADGSKDTGSWVGFQELPNGQFYSKAFKGYTERELEQAFDGESEKFGQISKSLGGQAISVGDLGFEFQVFPRFRIALVFWKGGAEFPDRVNVLFADNAKNYLSIYGLASAGSKFCNRFIDKYKEL